MMNDKLIAALLNERRAYVMRGLTDRVRAVDDALRDLGHVIETETASIDHDVETTSRKKPNKRRKG